MTPANLGKRSTHCVAGHGVPCVLLLVVALTAILMNPGCAEGPSGELNGIFDEWYEDYLRENPELATSIGRNEYDDRWRDWSQSGLKAWEDRIRSYSARLEAFDPESLEDEDALSLELLQLQLDDELSGLRYEAGLTRLNQLFGLHTTVLHTIREMRTDSEENFEDMLARIETVPAYIDQNIETLRHAIQNGLAQPRLIVDIVVRQLEIQAESPAAESPLLAPFRAMPESIPETRRREILERAEAAYEEAFQPAWASLRQFLTEEYAPAARGTVGVTGLPGGDAIYRFFIKHHTTLDLSAEEIHETGRREVERIHKAMEEVVQDAGFDGSVQEYERHLFTDKRYLFASREEMLAYHRDVAMRILPGLAGLFRVLPRHRVGIRAIPPDTEAASASNYDSPAIDGSRSAWFNLKAYRATEQSRFDKPALVLHETNPGHHLQIALQLELTGLPRFRRLYRKTAYVEGWALYAESLGHELGVYDDPASRFGALESERFRARRLVVDTGLHAMDWTREQAVEYLGDESEVDRYIAWPGQALAYKLGQLKIMELKKTAQDAHGASFNIKDFHSAVLDSGPLPLGMLEDRFGAYLGRASGTAESAP